MTNSLGNRGRTPFLPPVSSADAKNASSAYEYDPVGNLVRMTDRNGRVTIFAYDGLNRLTEVTDAVSTEIEN